MVSSLPPEHSTGHIRQFGNGEDEFFEIETFSSIKAFSDKATQYVIWFNVAKTNSYKGYKTPWQILNQRNKNISPNIALLPALLLDFILKKQLVKPNIRGYHIVQYPCSYSASITS